MDEDPTRSAAPPAAPPIRGGALSMPVRTRVWPTVLGVIAIVVGGYGMLYGASMLLMPFWREVFGASMPGDSTEMFDTFADLSVLLAVLLSGIASLLLAGGIGLIRRRRWAVHVLMLWAALRILMVVFSAVLAYDAQTIQFRAMSSQQGPSPLPASFGDVITVFTFVFTILWGWALPIFLIVWFRLRPVREETSGWGPRRGAGSTPPAAP